MHLFINSNPKFYEMNNVYKAIFIKILGYKIFSDNWNV